MGARFFLAVLTLATASVVTYAQSQGKDAAAAAKQVELKKDSLKDLQRLIAPLPDESKWMQVPWMPGSDIYAARKKAAEEGKPLLLWYMAGEPLGTC